MKSLLFIGVAASATVVAMPNAVASDSFGKLSPASFEKTMESSVEGTRGGGRSIGRGFRGRNFGGFRGGGFRGRGFKGGGFTGNRGFRGNRGNFFRGNRGFGGGFIGFYRRPSYGFVLPSYWLASSFGISNYGAFGLNQPGFGYSWSRYYDDAVLRNSAGTVYDYRQNIDWSAAGPDYAPNGYYQQVAQHQTQQPEFNPNIQADRRVHTSGQTVVTANTRDTATPNGFYDGQWSDIQTDANGVVTGVWRGQVADQNGQQYQATYRGTFTRDGQFQPTGAPISNAPLDSVAASPGFPDAPSAPVSSPDFQTPAGFESYERCLRNRGVKGGVIGSVIGAVAGNRIAGRGSRLEGSLIGGGVGALAGFGIEKALDKCERFLPVPQQQAPIAAGPAFGAPIAQAPIAQPPVFAQQQVAAAPIAPAPVVTEHVIQPGQSTTIIVPQQQQFPAAQAPVFAQQRVGFPAQQQFPAQQLPVNQTPAGFESYERCLKGRGVTGGVLGSVIGAVAGNRIAGRGNRLEGSLIGGGLGALAGVGIEKALKKCKRFIPAQRQQQYSRYPQQVGYYWVPGGYYYPPAQTTITVIPGTVTTTTTEYVESHVPTKRLSKPAVKRLRKPGY